MPIGAVDRGDLIAAGVPMDWMSLQDPQDVPSPGLLVDPERIQSNIDRMIAMVGGRAHAARLRPHLKTHKMAQVVQLQLDSGIRQFKAATIAEAELAAAAGAEAVLVAHQLVGPKIKRLAELVERFDQTVFATIVDDVEAMKAVASQVGRPGRPIHLYVDVDCGMGRTGIEFGAGLGRLRRAIEQRDDAVFSGLHVYDGHLHDPDVQVRRSKLQTIIQRVQAHMSSHGPAAVVGGGSPTFGLWATGTDWQCSPGTCLLWDVGYGQRFKDLPFALAAAVLTRVISKPGRDRLCLDLGYKAVAAEMPLEQRVHFPVLHEVDWVSQSEEHLVVSSANATSFAIGDALVGYPLHICPTVALHAEAHVVAGGQATGERWCVARDR
jgi:D-serine deaminase-like pyridoxal phosphate-dependent protein